MQPNDKLRGNSAHGPQTRDALAGGVADARGADVLPRTVIRGESPKTPQTAADAFVQVRVLSDWLNVTFPFVVTEPAIQTFVASFAAATGGVFGGMEEQGTGKHGWQRSFAFDFGKVLFAVGGQRNTAFLSLPGEGCSLVPSWSRLITLLRDDLRGRITRWDGAVDDFVGTHSVDMAVQLFQAGGFNAGGRSPLPGQAGNWLTPDDKGRTFYVGGRANGKYLRVYEKGKQLGRGDSPWVRWEVEFRKKDRVIPWEVLLEPDRFVAGAYPCMAWVGSERSRIATIRTEDTLTYSRQKEFGSIACGRLINVMLKREGSAERVVELLIRPGVPRRLAFSDAYLSKHGKGPGV